MASTYSTLKFELITTGEQSGTWGTTTNTNLGTAIQEAIAGRATANFTSDADLTLTLTDTNATQVARNFILNVTSGVSLTTTRSLIVPTINKPYIVENNTTGGQSITVKTSAGTGITIPNGKRSLVYADGTNVVSGNTYISDLTIGTFSTSTTIGVGSGGTGITSYAVGDLIYASGTTTLSKLADVATGSVLVSGGVNTAPAWSTTPTFVGTNISGTAASLTAGTANALTTGNNYQVNSLGVGTAGSGTAGEIRATNNITAYYSSDRKFKENITDIPNALSAVTAIGGKYFSWTDAYLTEHGGEDEYFNRKEDFGVIAQDVQAVFPRAVRERPDGTLAVDYEKLCALAFQAIKELEARVAVLEGNSK